MLHIVIIGIGENSGELVNQAIDDLKETTNICIDGIIFDEDQLYNKISNKQYSFKMIEDLPQMTFDKLLICAEESITDDVAQLFCDKLNLTAEQCYSHIRRNVGPHKIDWKVIRNSDDLVQQISRSEALNELEVFFYSKQHREIFKWLHYFEIYDRHFSKYRNKAPVVMEIGVFKGGSLQMWKEYFGEGAQIIGIDIDESVKAFEEDQISIEIGSQEDRDFLGGLKKKYPRIDILVDDGGHSMNQQIVTFEEMFPHISYGGTYLCEDLHTSYMQGYGGGYKNPNSYIEYSKNFIDYIHAWHSSEEVLQPNQYSRTIHSLHYYSSILVIEKEKMGFPMDMNI